MYLKASAKNIKIRAIFELRIDEGEYVSLEKKKKISLGDL